MSTPSRLSFSQKLFLVNLTYLLPCAVLVFFLIKEKNAQLAFSASEKAGLEIQRPLVSLLLHVSQHKALLHLNQQNENHSREKMSATQSLIEGDFLSLDDLSQRYGEVLALSDVELNARKKIDSSPKNLKGNWQLILSKLKDSNLQELNERHDQLISDILGGIGYVGDSSNLILDPDLDSYYIMDVTLLGLPKAVDNMRQLLSLVQSLPAGGAELSKEALIQFAIFSFKLKDDLARISSDVQIAINEDKKFYGHLPALQRELPIDLKTFASSQEKLSKLIDRMLTLKVGDSWPEAETAFLSSTLDVFDQSMVFWSKVAAVQEKLLDTRMDQHRWERIVAMILSFLAWLPPALLALLTVRQMSRSFSSAVTKLEKEADGAHSSSSQLASASSMVSSGSTEQAAAIQETGASMSEIASMIARSSTQALSSQDLARKVTQRADEGCTVMEKMVLSMESIHDANSQLQNISSIIHEISTKTNVINDIVGKTQLLSFNASIEAARAGQHGRGFAVVAEEVGNLAQTSGNAAKSIRELIDDSQKQVAHILKTTLERVSEGKTVTEQAQTIFGEIAQDISKISAQVESVTEAAREQQLGIEQISKAMMQMDQTTQSNNKAAHLAAHLSDRLAGQSQKLTHIARSVAQLVFGREQAELRAQSLGPNQGQRPAELETLGKGTSPLKVLHKNASKEEDDKAILEGLRRRNQQMAQPGESLATLSADDESFKEAV